MKYFFLFLLVSTYAGQSNAQNQKESVLQNSNDTVEYPGEVMRDSEGTKIKRWSTRGPVQVSQPPEPFEERSEKVLPPGTFINVDPSVRQNNARTVVSQPNQPRK